jgi:hypothetical protein
MDSILQTTYPLDCLHPTTTPLPSLTSGVARSSSLDEQTKVLHQLIRLITQSESGDICPNIDSLLGRSVER